MEEIIVYVSSRNNYSMLEGEFLKNTDLEGFEFINVDDRSSSDQQFLGKSICAEKDIVYLQNYGSGVQQATDTVMKFVREHRPKCKWLICFQHDNYPLSKNFFSRIATLVRDGKLDKFGLIGFNLLDDGEYCGDAKKQFLEGGKPLGAIAIFHFKNRTIGRVIAPTRTTLAIDNYEKFSKPFIVEMPMWAITGINLEKWFDHIEPTDNYEFHIWLPDIAMQFASQNVETLILPNLYCMNDQYLKEKYGLPKCSAHGAKIGLTQYFGAYGPHLAYFQKRWGWDYECPWDTFPKDKHQGTLLQTYFEHDLKTLQAPLKNYDLGDY